MPPKAEENGTVADVIWFYTKYIVYMLFEALMTLSNVAFVLIIASASIDLTGNKLFATLAAISSFIAARAGSITMRTSVLNFMFADKEVKKDGA